VTWEYVVLAAVAGALGWIGTTLMAWTMKRVADALGELREELAEWRKGRECDGR
jgi:hypothetical protein